MVRTYAQVKDGMDPPTRRLFLRLVENHLAHVDEGCTFHVVQFMGGTIDLSASHGAVSAEGVTMNRIEDLRGWGLIRYKRSKHGGTFSIPPDAVRFYRFLSESDAGAIESVEARATRETTPGSSFAANHPEAAEHLRQANLLLSDNDTAFTVVNEIGSHLRSALHTVSAAVLSDYTGSPEQALAEIVKRTKNSDFHADPAAAKLADFVQEVLREAQRLDHVRDEEHLGRPFGGWQEMRRAVTLTTVACTELALLAGTLEQAHTPQ